MPSKAVRFIGLDIHKAYLVAIGVDRELQTVFGPHKVTWGQFDRWRRKHLTPHDAIVLEMTVNSYRVYDALVKHVHSVAIVHVPAVRAITQAEVKTDRKAAHTLAQLHAAGLLKSIWVPPQDVRDLRAIIAQRQRSVRLGTQAKNRLHAVLHRHHLGLPEEGGLFAPENQAWWEALPVSPLEQVRIQDDWATLEYAQAQKERLEAHIHKLAGQDARVPLLVQIPGIGVLNAMTILGAVGDIRRFAKAKKLVGYAGLGSRVSDSGQKRTTGRITKRGRRDLRRALVDAANKAIESHPRWKREFARLEPRLGRSKAVVAVARKMLVAVWFILTEEIADREVEPEQVAAALYAHAYRIGVKNLPDGLTAREFVRRELDRLGFRTLTRFKWGSKTVTLPPELRKK